jgi:hypothetical protein
VNRPYLLTEAGIWPNKLGLIFRANALTPYMMRYLEITGSSTFAFPWAYYAAGLILSALLYVKPIPSHNPHLLLWSAYLLCVPMLLVTPSAEQRYHLWALAAISLATVLSASLYLSKPGKGNGSKGNSYRKDLEPTLSTLPAGKAESVLAR